MGRQKLARRREPTFDDAAAVRQGAAGGERRAENAARDDRSPANDDQPAKASRSKASAKPSRPRKRGGGGRGGGGGAKRSLPRRLLYWCFVLCLWGVLAVGGLVAMAAADLPPIQSLEIPKRPPSIEIVGTRRQDAGDPRRDARRGGPLKDLPPYLPKRLHRDRGSPLLQPLRHRPDRAGARADRQRAAPRRLAGRLDAHPAARQESVPDPGAHDLAQAAGSGAGGLARTQVQQGRDPRALSQPRLFRLRRVWRRCRGAALFRQVRAPGEARRSRDAGGSRAIAVAARAQPQSGRRRAACPDWCCSRWRRSASSPRPWPRAALAQPAHAVRLDRHRLGQLRRGLDHGRARRPGRPRRPGPRGRDHDRSDAAGGGREGAGR